MLVLKIPDFGEHTVNCFYSDNQKTMKKEDDF